MIQHISTEEVDEREDENTSPNPKPSVLDRLQPSTSKKCLSVFTHIEKVKDHKISVFNRIKDVHQPRHSVISKTKTSEKSSSSRLHQEESSTFSHLGVINEVQSSIPSSMKHFSRLDVKIGGSLRVKRHTVVFTGQRKNSDSNEKAEEEEVISSIISQSTNVMT